MTTFGTYLRNDSERPVAYGEIEVDDRPRRRLRGEPEKTGVPCETAFAGFCGTDHELMRMGRAGLLTPKFPEGRLRLVNGHEGVVYVPSENRFAIVLIRGGDSFDPTRYGDDETYFEYGCDGADGLFSDMNYYNPDMLLHIPDGHVHDGKLDLSAAKRLVFSDPFACMLFQLERMEDIGEAQNFRVEMAKNHCSEVEGRRLAKERIFDRTVVFGLGTTGIFIADLIKRAHPSADVVLVARSEEDSPKVSFAKEVTGARYVRSCHDSEQALALDIVKALGGRATMFIGTSGSEVESRIALQHKVLGCNGVYNGFSLGPKVSFDTMPFGFENHLIFGSINFRQCHMERAIELLLGSRYDELVELIDRDDFTSDPLAAYEEKIYKKGAPMKTAVVWNEKYINRER